MSAVRDAREPHWQLGPLPPPVGYLALVSWEQTPRPEDDGIPRAVAGVLARALTSVTRVTFPSSIAASTSADWTATGQDMVRTPPVGLGERLRAFAASKPATVTLVSTRRAEPLAGAFNDPAFPWWMQGQVLVLSDALEGPPDVVPADLAALLGDDWASRLAELAPRGVRGAVRPGVDGDVAGLLTLTDKDADRIVAALAREARLAGFVWPAS